MPQRVLVRKLAAFALSCCLAVSVSQADASTRSALVIGNGAYTTATELRNPPNDARAMATTLTAAGFKVSSGIDLDKSAMERVVTEFLKNLRGSDTALVFYAGHGLQVDGRNYLVPIDATLEDEVDVSFQALALDEIQAQMERSVDVSLIFLDACRDNPLARNLVRSMGKSRSTAVGQGLAETEGAVGALVAYATQPNNVALDGEDLHSPFTEALLKHIATPGMEIRQVLTRVRKDVIDRTDGRQVPWDHSSLTNDVYIRLGTQKDRLVIDSDPEIVFWQSIASSSDLADFSAYLERFGEQGLYAEIARNRLATLDSEAGLSSLATGAINEQDLSRVAQTPSGAFEAGAETDDPLGSADIREQPSQRQSHLAGKYTPPPEGHRPPRHRHRPPPPSKRLPSRR